MNPVLIVFVLFVLLIVFFCIGYSREKEADAKRMQQTSRQFSSKLNKDYTQRDFDVMHQSLLDYVRLRPLEEQEFFVDDITFHDLELDEVLKRLDFSQSFLGFFGLYRWLRILTFDQNILLKRENMISFFEKHMDLLLIFSVQCSKIRMFAKTSLFEFYKKDDDQVALPFLSMLLDAMMIVAFLLALIWQPFMWFALIGLIVFQMLRYPMLKKQYDSEIKRIGFVLSLIHTFKPFLRYKDTFGDIFSDDFSRMQDIILRNRRNDTKAIFFQFASSKSATGDFVQMILLYLNMVFHIDYMMTCFMQKNLSQSMDDVVDLMQIIGDFEAAISVAHIRASFDRVSVPNLTLAKNFSNCEMKDLYHPLIDEPVVNDISFNQAILLTGSNASGKSTFMKSVALNVLFAQSIHTVFASSYTGPYTRVYSSMALRDHLLQKESYFVVELKSMKRILDGVIDDNYPVLIVIDEILRGTNTKERIGASTALLQFLQQKHIFVIAATHDVELTKLLQNEYANYHFSEYVKDKCVYFPYQLQKGAATGRNALALMESFGFDEAIIQKANAYLQHMT